MPYSCVLSEKKTKLFTHNFPFPCIQEPLWLDWINELNTKTIWDSQQQFIHKLNIAIFVKNRLTFHIYNYINVLYTFKLESIETMHKGE